MKCERESNDGGLPRGQLGILAGSRGRLARMAVDKGYIQIIERDGMNLWPHQRYALDEYDRLVTEGARNICVTSPTGGGKTLIMQKVIEAALPKDSDVYTDRIMLRSQLSKGLTDVGLDHGIRASGVEPALLRTIQLCMMQTEGSRSLDNERREVHPAELVIIDEAHKMAAGTMTALDEEHLRLKPERIKLGFTATPLGIGHFYDELIVAGTNSELRDCGALLLADHRGVNEPDTKWIGKVAVDGGECGIASSKRTEYAHRVFGSVTEHIPIYNPELLPMLLFAPGVAESKWFAQELSRHNIPSAHIAGDGIWVDGEELDATDDNRQMILERHKAGEIKCICNRFVMREGIDAPWIYHGIFATVFGSLTSYLQAGGRLLRNHPSMDHIMIQDHGGNYHRHGSLNADREWDLGYDDRIVQGVRKSRLQWRPEVPRRAVVGQGVPRVWLPAHGQGANGVAEGRFTPRDAWRHLSQAETIGADREYRKAVGE